MTEHAVVDGSVLREIEDWQMVTNPYDDFSKLVENVGQIRGYLIEAARREETREYDQLSHDLSIGYDSRGALLGFVSLHEGRFGRPPLSALVISAQEHKDVGDGYWKMVPKNPQLTDNVPSEKEERTQLWREHRDAVFDEWT